MLRFALLKNISLDFLPNPGRITSNGIIGDGNKQSTGKTA
jgi:hypothetical protein